jgi:hypothetical protein
MQEQTQALRKGLSRVWLLWGAILGSLVVYLLIVQVVAPAGRPMIGREVGGLRVELLLFGLALLVFLFAGLLRRAMLARPPAPGPEATDARIVQTALSRYFVAVVVSNALVESVGILALVLYFVGVPSDTVYSLILLTALGMLLLRPRWSELDALADALRRG